MPIEAPERDQPLYTVIPTHAPISRLLRHARDTEDTFSTSQHNTAPLEIRGSAIDTASFQSKTRSLHVQQYGEF